MSTQDTLKLIEEKREKLKQEGMLTKQLEAAGQLPAIGATLTTFKAPDLETKPEPWVCPTCQQPQRMAWNVVVGGWNIYANQMPYRDICVDCRELEKQAITAVERKLVLIDEWNLDVGKHKEMRFSQYKPRNDSQKAALAAAQGLAEVWKKKLAGSLWLWSNNYGLGKTHLTYSLLWQAVQLGYTVAVWDEVSLLTEIKATYQPDNGNTKWTEDKLLKHASTVDVLAWDDMGRGYVRAQSQAWYQGIAYNVLNFRYDSARPIIVTSNRTPSSLLRHIGGAAYSRLKGMCPVPLEIVGADYRMMEGE